MKPSFISYMQTHCYPQTVLFSNMGFLDLIEHVTFALVVAVLFSIYFRKGPKEFFRIVLVSLKELPGVDGLIGYVLHSEVTNFLSTSALKSPNNATKRTMVRIPKKGVPHEELREMMKKMKSSESTPDKDKLFAYVYTLHDDHFDIQREAFDMFSEKVGGSVDHETIVREFHHAFMHENALNPMVFPSLRKMETEVVSMTAAMLNGSETVVGFLTSGGTESNLMAVKTFRDMARKLRPHIAKPEIVAPITIHPTIEKAAHYFGLRVVHVPVDEGFRADVVAMEKAITPNTVMLTASAPQFCHGVVDPIDKISALALKKGLPFHVDACFGGFMLPWVEQLGYPVCPFDFRNPGVTSVSADIHKYGYGAKGASVIMYRDSEIRKFQIYSYAEWPGGLYGSPSMAGTRPGGNIAAAWCALKAMGEDGYMEKAKELMDTTTTLIKGINAIPGLYVLGEPAMTSFSVGSSDASVDIQAVADAMGKRGWTMERQQNPSCLHFSILPHLVPSTDKLIEDMRQSFAEVKDNKALAKKGTAAMYGMIATIPDKAIIQDFVTEFFSEVYK